MASAQIIESDGLPAPTSESIIAPAVETSVDRRDRLSTFGTFGSSAQYSSNPLSLSNLPGGFELEADGDVVWRNAASAGIAYNINDGINAFVRGEIGHTKYFDQDFLSFVSATTTFGIAIRPSNNTSILVAGLCSSERDDSSFEQFFGYCAPLASFGVTTGDPWNGSGTRLSVNAIAPRGSQEKFGRFFQAGAAFEFEGGASIRFRAGPRGFVRWYELPEDFASVGGNRKDYQISLGTAVFYRSPRLDIGIEAQPRVNWSSYEQYRYWSVDAGPFIQLRF